MKDSIFKIGLLIAVIIIAILLIFPRNNATVEPIYIYNDSIVYKEIKVPTPYEVVDTFWLDRWNDTIIYRDIIIPVDTAAILADYFKLRIYNDTIINTDELLVSLRDSVTLNRLWGREVKYQNFRPIAAKCPDVSDRAFYLGVIPNGNINQFGIAPSIGLTNKNNLYFYSYDVINNNHSVGVYWKINTSWKILP